MNALIVLSALIGAAVAVPAYGPAVISSGYGLGGLSGLGAGLGYGAGIGYGAIGGISPIAATTYRTQSSVLAPVGVVKSVVATPAITTIAAPAIVSSGYGLGAKGLGLGLGGLGAYNGLGGGVIAAGPVGLGGLGGLGYSGLGGLGGLGYAGAGLKGGLY